MNIFKQKEREFALQRAQMLRERFPEAGELLSFLKGVLEFQNQVIEELLDKELPFDVSSAFSRIDKGKPAIRLVEIDWSGYIPFLKELLKVLSDIGTEEIRVGTEELARLNDEEIKGRLSQFLEGKEVSEVERLFFLSWLQPVLYTLSNRIEFNHEVWLKNVCPVCGLKPSVSFLMDTPEWEGARFLRCHLCLTDWLYERTRCAVCGNNEDDKLSYYTTEEIKHIELQVCNLCNHYIKIVDMRKDGLAVPDVDDIATVALDLWAGEQGYLKVEKNLLGL